MLKTLLVPLDGSALAERAVPFAARLSRETGARLVLVRAAPEAGLWLLELADLAEQEAAPPQLTERERAEAELAEVAGRLQAEGLQVETRVIEDDAVHAIQQVAGEIAADLIVMSTHGRSGLGRWIYGSVADRIMRRAEVPVLLVPAGSEGRWEAGQPCRVLVALDGSDLAREALGPASELARALSAELLLVRVVAPPSYVYPSAYPYLDQQLQAELAEAERYLEGVATELRAQGLAVARCVAVGSPASTIVGVAREQRADLIAMATHSRGGLARLVMGSVATGTVQRAEVPVLLVRPGAARRAARPSPAAAAEPAAAAGGMVSLSLTEAELDLLERGLRELIANPEREARLAKSAWELLKRLRQREQASAAPAGRGQNEPVGPTR